MVVLSLVLPAVAVWLALRTVIRDPLLRGGLAVALGLGASSATFVAALAIRGRVDSSLLFIDIGLWTGLAALAWWYSPAVVSQAVDRLPERPWAVAMLAGAATFSVLAAARFHAAAPHGAWDAWAIWNLRARFLASGTDWTQAFSPALAWSHPDYPLMLPATVARLWAWHGSQPTWIPTIVSMLCAAATLMVVAGSLAQHRVAAGLALLAAPWAVQGAWQLADVPLSLFMASATTLLISGTEPPDRRLLFLAGFASSLAAWTKNEGLPFVAASALALMVWAPERLPRWRALALWTAGAVPVLALLAWFKMALAPQSYFAQPSVAAIDKLLDPERHSGVLQALPSAAGLEWIVAYAAAAMLFAWNAPRAAVAARRAAMIVALMLAAFYLAYVLTPHLPRWQVETSLSRLLAQVWPTVLLALGYLWQSRYGNRG